MRTFSILAFASVLLPGCAGSPVPARPERASVLAGATSLRGVPIVTRAEGGWETRTATVARADGGPSTAGPAGPSTPGPAGPTTGAPGAAPGGRGHGGAYRGPGDGAPVPTHSDEFFMGTGLSESRVASGAPPATPLRAGATDDNLDHDAFVAFLRAKSEGGVMKGRCQELAVDDRRAIAVLDRNGAPLPGAEVCVVDEGLDRVVWRGTTYGDGRFPFYPGMLPTGTSGRPAAKTWLLEVRCNGGFLRHHWNGAGRELTVRMPGVDAETSQVKLDVVFLIDTTGSMGDEIDRIKQSLLGVTAKLRSLEREFDLRYGAVLYRDIGDRYVTARHAFTGDLAKFDAALKGIAADGGGDTAESLNQGLAVAVDDMDWRPAAAKVVFLIADAPPHMDYEGDVLYGDSLQAAVARGVRVHSVAASGLDDAGTIVFRQIAHFTRGKFVFIEYGTIAATAEGHGVTGEVKSNNLDDILFEQIRDEIAGFGRLRREI